MAMVAEAQAWPGASRATCEQGIGVRVPAPEYSPPTGLLLTPSSRQSTPNTVTLPNSSLDKAKE